MNIKTSLYVNSFFEKIELDTTNKLLLGVGFGNDDMSFRDKSVTVLLYTFLLKFILLFEFFLVRVSTGKTFFLGPSNFDGITMSFSELEESPSLFFTGSFKCDCDEMEVIKSGFEIEISVSSFCLNFAISICCCLITVSLSPSCRLICCCSFLNLDSNTYSDLKTLPKSLKFELYVCPLPLYTTMISHTVI
ncbi:hypothetical protein AGLY_008416 [Aphis glycines]|uniref:Uncharacterized protein n=1 Tax=Aphis glycines TaxID=307491 RepID=A0A6G0TL73_APHGL|nr:hypothetical protein AGLY_008416 [Aphis glycines]